MGSREGITDGVEECNVVFVTVTWLSGTDQSMTSRHHAANDT